MSKEDLLRTALFFVEDYFKLNVQILFDRVETSKVDDKLFDKVLVVMHTLMQDEQSQ